MMEVNNLWGENVNSDLSVLLSIQPEWCEQIISGIKTYEVRKTVPKSITVPLKCYIYQTIRGKSINNGKVIAEFVCDRIDALPYNYELCNYSEMIQQSCVDKDELEQYRNGKSELFFWHISDLLVYKTPKELRQFRQRNNSVLIKAPQSWSYVK